MLWFITSSIYWLLVQGNEGRDRNRTWWKKGASSLTIETTYGPVKGFYDEETNTNIWLGIPFAAPPIGDLRFKPPQPHKKWTLAKSALKASPDCAQLRITGFVFTGQEDCLYLDVYTPANATAPLPVLVYIHGGAFVFGSAEEYDGRKLAIAEQAMVVVLQYRLDVFGFLALDALKNENEDASTGNYALQDQNMGLRWVDANLEAFGGDKDHVLLFGESAGGFSVCSHLAMPSSKGLFTAAVVESGTCDSPEFFFQYEQAAAFGEEYVTTIGCGKDIYTTPDLQLECLRTIKTRLLMTPYLDIISGNVPRHPSAPLLSPLLSFGPVIDGSQAGLPMMPLDAMQSGNFNQVPTIFGTNKDEGSIFVPLVPIIVENCSNALTDEDIDEVLKHFFGEELVEQIQKKYPPRDYESNNNLRLAAIIRDVFFVCSSRRANRALNDNFINTYAYEFTYPINSTQGEKWGVYHSAELQYIFDQIEMSDSDKYITSAMQSYWKNLATYGDVNDPNDAEALHWPEYTETGDEYMKIDYPLSVFTGYKAELCDFWDTIER